jgi:hypothetical protein
MLLLLLPCCCQDAYQSEQEAVFLLYRPVVQAHLPETWSSNSNSSSKTGEMDHGPQHAILSHALMS